MDKGTVIAAIITGLVTVIGWYAAYLYAKRQEDRTRRFEIQLKYRQQQIEELYGPLLSLIEQVFNVWQVRENILKPPQGRYEPAKEAQIREFFWKSYFYPLHQEIAALLKTKLFLLDKGTIPPSFNRYLEHATQEACQHRLHGELGIDTSHVPGTPWPDAFFDDVNGTLNRLMTELHGGIKNLSV